MAGIGFGLSRVHDRDLTTASAEAYDLYRQGNEYLISFQHEAGVQELEKALELDSGFAMAAAALAEGYNATRRYAQRDSLAQIADSLAADLADPAERMLVQLRLGNVGFKRWSAARDSLHEALLEVAPDNVILLSSLAAEAKRDQDPDGAEYYHRRILERNPNYALAYNELGYLAFYRGDFGRAIDMLQRYAFLAPDIANPYDSLGEIYLELGRYGEAEAQLLLALQRQPDYLPSLLNLVRVYLAQGQAEKGTKLIQDIWNTFADTPFERGVMDFAIRSYYTARLWDRLALVTTEFVAKYPDHPRSVLFHAMHLAMSQRADEAEAVLDSCLADWQERPSYQESPKSKRSVDGTECEFRALICQARGLNEQAAAQWGRALELFSETWRSHQLVFLREEYAANLLACGRRDEALAQTEVIFSLNPANGNALLVAAEATLQDGDLAQADGYLTRLESVLQSGDPDFPLLVQARDLRTRLTDLAAGS